MMVKEGGLHGGEELVPLGRDEAEDEHGLVRARMVIAPFGLPRGD